MARSVGELERESRRDGQAGGARPWLGRWSCHHGPSSERTGTAVVTSSGGLSVATRSTPPQARFWEAESTEQSAPASGSARWWTECSAVSSVKTVSNSDRATAIARQRSRARKVAAEGVHRHRIGTIETAHKVGDRIRCVHKAAIHVVARIEQHEDVRAYKRVGTHFGCLRFGIATGNRGRIERPGAAIIHYL